MLSQRFWGPGHEPPACPDTAPVHSYRSTFLQGVAVGSHSSKRLEDSNSACQLPEASTWGTLG